jgi:hypothetical protein
LHGLITDKVSAKVERKDGDLYHLTDAELAARIRELEARQGQAPDASVGEKKPH